MAFTERFVTSAAGGGGNGTEGNPWTLAEALINAAAGDRVNQQSDAGYSLGADAFNAGTVSAPIVLRGYNLTIGDLDNLGRNADGTLIINNMPDITLTGLLTMNNHCVLQNLDITGAISGPLIGNVAVDQWHMISCRVVNTQNNAAAECVRGDNGHQFVNCDFSCTGAAHQRLVIVDLSCYICGCRFETTSSLPCLQLLNGFVVGCSFFGNGSSDGIRADELMAIDRPLYVDHCTFHGIGRPIVASTGVHTATPCVTNCHVTDSSEYFDNTSATTVYVIEANNRLRDVTTPRTGLEPITINEVTTDTGGPETDYNDAGSDDFRLITTAPGYQAGMTPFTSIGAAHVAGGTLMTETKWLADTTVQTVINDNATLANGVRAAGDYDNGTELDLYCTAYLTVQYDGGPPAAGLRVANLYILPGDGAATEVFPDGGDAGLGTDDTPQKMFFVGSFESINPSLTVDEVLALPGIPLSPDGNRFVVLNTSGQTFDLTWQLDIKPYKLQSV